MGGGIRCKVSESHNFFEKIVFLENLFLAWNEFKKGKTKKADVQYFNLFLEDNIFELYYQLVNKTYRHSNYTSFYVKDPKLRHIHKACVKDRVLHHSVFRILYPVFDKSFVFDSYSCRINKGTYKAVNRLQSFCRKESRNNTKTTYALKLDIRKFFDSINHDLLLSLMARKIKDKEAVWLIKIIINSFSLKPKQGIPLGNITSQLFANIYLNELDYFIKHILKVKYYIRYCDDFVITNRNKEYLKNLIPVISSFLNNNLKLSLHQDKIVIRKYEQGIDFLGYVIFPRHRLLRTKTKKRMFRKINDNNLQSYLGLLKHCNGYKIIKNLKLGIKNCE